MTECSGRSENAWSSGWEWGALTLGDLKLVDHQSERGGVALSAQEDPGYLGIISPILQ